MFPTLLRWDFRTFSFQKSPSLSKKFLFFRKFSESDSAILKSKLFWKSANQKSFFLSTGKKILGNPTFFHSISLKTNFSLSEKSKPFKKVFPYQNVFPIESPYPQIWTFPRKRLSVKFFYFQMCFLRIRIPCPCLLYTSPSPRDA